MKTYAPIILFVYNRPEHTQRTVEALLQNLQAKESELFIFSDAPKTPEAADAVHGVRAYIHTITGFRSVKIIEREKNWGLAKSIIEGVSSVINKYGRVIVLEDDLITSIHFLSYMNDALEAYAREDRVMHVSGSTYPIGRMEEETFLLRVPLCWGWGTWARAWCHFRKDISVMEQFSPDMRRQFRFNDTYHYWDQLEANSRGKIDTWFVYWYATLFLRGGLALFPRESLVQNIGMDGSGVHCGISPAYEVEPSGSPVNVLPIPIRESREAVRRHEAFFRRVTSKRSFFERAYGSLCKVMARFSLALRIK